MVRSRLHFSRALLVAAAYGLAGCHASPSLSPNPDPAPAARACPARVSAGTDWIVVDDSAGFTVALPPGFQERPSGGASRYFELAPDFEESISIGIIRGELGVAGYRRVYQPALMLDYSECSEVIGGATVSIQAWRTPNGVFRNFQRFDRYDVFAIWEVGPGGYGYLTGGTYRRPTQDLMLATIRSLRARRE